MDAKDLWLNKLIIKNLDIMNRYKNLYAQTVQTVLSKNTYTRIYVYRKQLSVLSVLSALTNKIAKM